MADRFAFPPPSEWPIAVYHALDGAIPGEPFVAYPMVPTVGKKGERSYLPSVRCSGKSAEEARAAAQAWIASEVEKNARRAAGAARRGKRASA